MNRLVALLLPTTRFDPSGMATVVAVFWTYSSRPRVELKFSVPLKIRAPWVALVPVRFSAAKLRLPLRLPLAPKVRPACTTSRLRRLTIPCSTSNVSAVAVAVPMVKLVAAVCVRVPMLIESAAVKRFTRSERKADASSNGRRVA